MNFFPNTVSAVISGVLINSIFIVFLLLIFSNFHHYFIHLPIIYSEAEKRGIQGWGRWLKLVIPALWEDKEGGSPEVRSSRPAWTTWRNPVSTKNTKISQAWWWVPIIPATQEAEAGELLEPGRWRLQ